MSRVFVLGAGSSKAVIDSAPLNNELLSRALAIPNDSRIEEIKKFISAFYVTNKVPPLEDVLTQIDLCIAEKRSISRKYNLAKLGELHNDLVYAICVVLQKALETSSLNLMEHFIKQLQREDTIISLNYDLIVDNTMWRSNLIADYSFSVRNYLEKYGRNWDNSTSGYRSFIRSSPDNVRNLLKLHGSLNWLYCPCCERIDVTPGQKGAIYVFAENDPAICEKCGTPYESLIIAPTFLKDYQNSYLKRIWQQAEEKLRRATEIVFIGYSMPDADVILRMMFSRAVYRHSQLKPAPNQNPFRHPLISVIDTNPGVCSRYKDLFGTVTYFDTNFEHYVTHKMQV